MKKEISVGSKDTPLTLLSGITFAQVPYWFPFYEQKDLKMDIILPFRRTDEKPRPLLLWVCGGAWITMDRSAHIPWLSHIARRGFTVASVEYRLSNSAHFPAQLEDIKKAVRYLRAHATAYGIDPDRIAVGGESAGAYLAAMAGASNGRKEYDKGEYLEQSGDVQAVIDYYGPACFTLEPPCASAAESQVTAAAPESLSPAHMLLGYDPMKHPDKAALSAPLSLITPSAPPFFIAHGTEDHIVPIINSELLYAELEKNNVPAEFYAIRNAGHADMQFYQEEMAEKIADFLLCHLGS